MTPSNYHLLRYKRSHDLTTNNAQPCLSIGHSKGTSTATCKKMHMTVSQMRRPTSSSTSKLANQRAKSRTSSSPRRKIGRHDSQLSSEQLRRLKSWRDTSSRRRKGKECTFHSHSSSYWPSSSSSKAHFSSPIPSSPSTTISHQASSQSAAHVSKAARPLNNLQST